VTVDGQKAGLLYVQERQINLKLPPRASGEQTLLFVVRYQGLSSPAVPVQPRRNVEPAMQGVERARISLLGRAYVHMPIWIAVNLPGRHQATVRYPITVYPADFGGHDFEVRRDNLKLPKIKTAATAPEAVACLACRMNLGRSEGYLYTWCTVSTIREGIRSGIAATTQAALLWSAPTG
jgi:hypothetical protein